MIDLLFIRHGPTEWNEAGRIQGRRDVPLTPRARDSVSKRRLPNGFGERCAGYRARSFAPGRPRTPSGRRSSRSSPVSSRWTGGSGKAGACPCSGKSWGAAIRENEARGLDFETPAGDSPRRVQARLRSWLGEIARGGRPVAAVSHKGVGRALLALATGWDMKEGAPVRLRWDHAHRFGVSDSGEPRLVEPNIALVVRPEGA